MSAPRVLLDVPPASPVWGVPLPAPLASNNTVVERIKNTDKFDSLSKSGYTFGWLKFWEKSELHNRVVNHRVRDFATPRSPENAL